ncbi:Os02g0189900 [Oryza sativa Japonica Group]|uniref:Os02g0189900 protein n=3 Tax=Oryza sativa TaxID=4530 RepID=Q0E378_ORYSJ|nr:hypothetical protein OsI_06177 [Oryza sativa Indica Group]BAF08060.1 Os02g0189900 [Oryza sativa Japonica Group]BAS77389.1 Os02g0189900 [Oryza sativa Japonica Group]|eukprot:NP_001046146.1 Os02g0189900 [Oryza sativa Japonica Group]
MAVADHLKVRKNSEESSTQWTTGIAEVQPPIKSAGEKLCCSRNEEGTPQALRQLGDEAVCVGRLGGGDHLLRCGVLLPEQDVLPDAGGEQRRLLAHQPHLRSQPL